MKLYLSKCGENLPVIYSLHVVRIQGECVYADKLYKRHGKLFVKNLKFKTSDYDKMMMTQ